MRTLIPHNTYSLFTDPLSVKRPSLCIYSLILIFVPPSIITETISRELKDLQIVTELQTDRNNYAKLSNTEEYIAKSSGTQDIARMADMNEDNQSDINEDNRSVTSNKNSSINDERDYEYSTMPSDNIFVSIFNKDISKNYIRESFNDLSNNKSMNLLTPPKPNNIDITESTDLEVIGSTPQTYLLDKLKSEWNTSNWDTDDNGSLKNIPTPINKDEFLSNSTNRPYYQSGLLEAVPSNSNGVVTILGLFELSRQDATRPEGAAELAAARLAVRHVNQRNVLPGYSLRLITNDTKCDAGVGVDRFFHALYTESSRMLMLLGTACSEVTERLAKIVPYWNMVQVSFGSTSPALSDRSKYPLTYRTVAPDSSHNPARIAFIRRFGWDAVTAFSQNEEVYSLAVNELVTELEAANITCTASITFAESDLEEQLQHVKELDTRIIIGSFSSKLMTKIFCEAYRLGIYGEQYVWIVSGSSMSPLPPPSPPCPAVQLAAALEALVTVDANNDIVGDQVSVAGLTNEMFRKELRELGVNVSPFAPQTYDAVWSVTLALRNSEDYWKSRHKDKEREITEQHRYGLRFFDYSRKDMAEEFIRQLGKLNFLGVSGPVSFKGADRIGISSFNQIQEGVSRTVALYSGGVAVRCAACSEARWGSRGTLPAARRILRVRVDSVWAPARIAVTSFAGAGVVLALFFLAFNIHYSKFRSIKLSSPRLNNMTLIGCIFIYKSVALLGLDTSTLPSYISFSAVCTARVYTMSAGFSLAFGSMFAKTYRVYRILISNRSGVCKTKLLQDAQLMSLVCALLLIDGLVVSAWTLVDPMERHLHNLTTEISVQDNSVVYQPQIEVCKSRNSAGWLCVLYAYKGLFLIVGVYMAWETRHVKIPALNDSKYIGLSVYAVVITSASVVVLGTLISERATLAYVTTTSLILVSTTATLCFLFLPKIISILNKSDADPVTESLGFKLECKTRRFVTDETQELRFRIEIQNKVFHREIAALDKEISRLEKLLSRPDSSSSSSASVHLQKIDETQEMDQNSKNSNSDNRTPSITGGLPLLLLSVLPPVIPRASWPTTGHMSQPRPQITFSSQPKLEQQRSQPAIDLYNLCLNRRSEENTSILSRIRNIIGSKPNSRKASTMSITEPTSQGITAALKKHMDIITGLVHSSNRRQMVVSCNTLNVPITECNLRRESHVKSGPIIWITDEPSTSQNKSDSLQEKEYPKYIAQSETKVNFILPEILQDQPSTSHSCERIKGSPRFPHRISPASSNISTLDNRRNTNAGVFCISTQNFNDTSRRKSDLSGQ